MNPDSANLYEFELAGRTGIYELAWPQLNVTAKVERIKEGSDHEVKAEIQLTSTRPTSAGHLRAGRLNLTSPAARNTFARSLASRDSEVDWDKVMEQLCITVLAEWREGSPAVLLTGQSDVQASVKWMIEPIIQLNNPTLIYGPGSTGKSWFGQYLAVLADAGMNSGGLGVEPSTGLYLDWETAQDELDSRVTLLRNGLGLDGPSSIWYKHMTSGLSADIETIRGLCATNDVQFIVIDSVGSACMGEPESAEVVLRAFGALRSLGVSSLCIDHTNKEGALFGSVYKYNASRQVFECKKDQQPDDNKIVLGLFHKKANNSRLMKPIGYELNFSDSAISISRQDVRDTPLEAQMRVVDRIENLLKTRPSGLPVSDIAEELEKTESHIRKELSEAKKRGLIVQIGNNYSLASFTPEINGTEIKQWQL